MTDSILLVDGLTKSYTVRTGPDRGERRVAVDGIHFTVARGMSFGVVGESGSGKTTTARIIAGLESASDGKVEVGGVDRASLHKSAKSRRKWARKVQMVFQDPYSSLDPRRTIAQAIDEVLELHFALAPDERRERVIALLHQVGLDERLGARLPKHLSGGERQRGAIARALAIQPELLILDEAVAALDVSVQSQILNLLADLREQSDVSYLFLSHDLAVIRQVTDSAIVMQAGRIVETAPTEELLDDPKDPYTKLLLSCVPHPGWKPRRTRGEREAATLERSNGVNGAVEAAG